jgi:glyoxalase family protein
MITGDAQRNVEFYAGVLGLRLVKKTVNFDAPDAYHLYFGDEAGAPGSILTWFEFPGAARGRPGIGMIHTLQLGVASEESLAFWEQRLAAAGYESRRTPGSLRFEDYDGLALELMLTDQPPLRAEHPEIPAEHALQGFDAVRAYSSDPERSRALLEKVLEARPAGESAWELRGERRGAVIAFEPAPAQPGRQSAGTVHHVAWGTTVADHPRWLERLHGTGVPNSGVIDRHYFHSIYFREPSGVLFEIADDAPGFTVDVPLDRLGSVVILPPRLEPYREQIEARLTPLPDPRAGWAVSPSPGA